MVRFGEQIHKSEVWFASTLCRRRVFFSVSQEVGTFCKEVSTFSLGSYVLTTAGALTKVAIVNTQTNECNCPNKKLFLEASG